VFTEIEAKLKVDSIEQVEDTLRVLGAEFVAEQVQSDYHFDDERGTLAKADKCLRLRRQAAGGQEKYFLTYKGPKEKSNLKKRQEVEVEVSDGESVRKLLELLGYTGAMVVQKKRRLWRVGSCEVALDKLDLLGEFVEIEGDDEKQIEAVQEMLGLSGLQHIPKSYAGLIRSRLKEIGRGRHKT
jgi:adenylate cyclase class 2